MCPTLFHRNHKAQAALEFLMTYGWAILVVLVVIGALAYFGVLSPSNLLPEKCTFPVSISCKDYTIGIPMGINTYGHILILRNGAGRDMKVTRVYASSEALGTGNLGCGCSTGNINTVLRNGAEAEFELLVSDTISGCSPNGWSGPGNACAPRDTGRDKNRYNITLTYNWLDSPGITHQLSGELLAKKK